MLGTGTPGEEGPDVCLVWLRVTDPLSGLHTKSWHTKGPKVTTKVALEGPKDVFGHPGATNGNTQGPWP